MALSRPSAYINESVPRYRQGDILRDVQIVEWAELVQDSVEVSERTLPYCVVLSQECDLEHDFNNHEDPAKRARDSDKCLQWILVCPAYPAEQLKLGTHLEEMKVSMQRIPTADWNKVKQNGVSRYHVLPEDGALQIPELAIDFKHYVTIPRRVAYRNDMKSKVLASLGDLFREHLSSRFAHYLSRIGLPELDSV